MTPRTPRADLLLVIPCFNEDSNVGPLLDELTGLRIGCDVVVVDDGSSDDTYGVAAGSAFCIRLSTNLGIGGAVQTGLRYAREQGYRYCVQVDGDGQHLPAEIPKLLSCAQESAANVVIGSRFLRVRPGAFSSTRLRRMGIAILRVAFRLLYARRVTDPTSGFRLLDAAAIRLFSSEYPADYPEPISLAHALRAGLTFQEVPVEMRPRRGGTSSIAGIHSLFYMLRVVGYLVLQRLAR